MTSKSIKVLVVDDHPIVRRGLCTEINLNSMMQVVGVANNGIEAIQLAAALKPDVILMDIVMPEMDGIQATKEILQIIPEAKVLILTSFTEDEKIFSAVSAGASGYLFKDTHPDKVLQAILDIYHDIPVMSPNITRKLLKKMRQEEKSSSEPILTSRENEILIMVATGLLYKNIGKKLNIQETTVRAHVSNILSKLNLSNRSQLVLYAVKNDLIDADTLEMDAFDTEE